MTWWFAVPVALAAVMFVGWVAVARALGRARAELADGATRRLDIERTVTELSADPHRMVVNPRPIVHPVDKPLEIRLDEISLDLPGMETCSSQGEIKGFRLLRIEASDGGETKILHEDKTIPQSRGCPNGYRIGGVQTFSKDKLSAYAVLISVRQYGFEGPDHRWIAVTGRP